MLLKERQWSQCKTCNHRDKLLNEDVYGCDSCKAVLDLNKPGVEYLEATRFMQRAESTRHHFCSWRCLVKWLKKAGSDHFITLPYLSYDTVHGKKFTKEFLKLVSRR
jgi:hypothetical protein